MVEEGRTENLASLRKENDLVAFEKKLADKSVVIFKEDFLTLTVLCHLKENTEKYMIQPSKRGSVLWSCYMLFLIVTSMLYCVAFAVFYDENGEFTVRQAHSYEGFLIKIPCILALHFFLSPEVENAMNIMKFANQQTDQFIPGGSELCFALGLTQMILVLIMVCISIRMLAFQISIAYCIMYFVMLKTV